MHRWAHFGALALLAVGLVTDQALPLQLAAVCGAVGAVAFGRFVVEAVRRRAPALRAATRKAAPPSASP